MFIFIYIFIFLSTYLPIYLSIYLPLYQPIHLTNLSRSTYSLVTHILLKFGIGD